MNETQYIHSGGEKDGLSASKITKGYVEMPEVFSHKDGETGITKKLVRHRSISSDEAVKRILTSYPDVREKDWKSS